MSINNNIFTPGKDSNQRRDPAVERKAAPIDRKTGLPGKAPERGPLAKKI